MECCVADSNPGGAAAGCLGLIGMVVVASCVFGGSGKSSSPDDSAAVNATSVGSASDADPTAQTNGSEADVAKARAIVKDQFFPDQEDHSGSAKYQKEWYMIKGIVREAGYPCAAVAYVQQQMDGTFKAVCKVALHTNKFDAFSINPDSQSVDPL